jgi:hypothetical protein
MIFAMRIVGVTINQSAKEAREGRLAGADLEVTITTGANLNVRVVPDLTARPEVDAAAPVYRALEGGANTHGELAVQAALAMREGLAYVNQKRAVLGQPTLAFGMGLNTGEVTAGATGSEERQEKSTPSSATR